MTVDQVQLQELQSVSHNSVGAKSCFCELLNCCFIPYYTFKACFYCLKEHYLEKKNVECIQMNRRISAMSQIPIKMSSVRTRFVVDRVLEHCAGTGGR